MKFRLIENKDFLVETEKKHKKDPTKGKMGWFTSFMPDKEKGMEVLNKNLDNNITSSESSQNSTGDSSSNCCEEFIDEDRVANLDGSLTRKAQILLDVYTNSGKYSKAELLQHTGYPNWDKAGHWSTQWSDFTHKGLIECKKGKVFAGPTLEEWIITNNVVKYSDEAKRIAKAYDDKIVKELTQAGIQILDDNTLSFPDDYFDN